MIELSTPAAGSLAQNAVTPPRMGIHRVLRQVWSTGIGRFALICVVALLLCAVFSPWLAPHNPIALSRRVLRLKGPSTDYWLGNDQLGRDILSRLIYGTRIAMMVAFVGTCGALLLGSLLGLVAGYGPRQLDMLLMLQCDSLMSIPMILFALAVVTLAGSSLAGRDSDLLMTLDGHIPSNDLVVHRF